MHIYGRKIFSDTENPITIFYKLKSKFKDISILESVIGGENKGRYSIIFFNIVEDVKIYENYALKNNKKVKISSPNNYLKEISKLNKVKNHYDLPIPIPFLIGNMCFDLSKFTLPKLKYDRSKNQIHIPLAHVVPSLRASWKSRGKINSRCRSLAAIRKKRFSDKGSNFRLSVSPIRRSNTS